MKAFLPGIFILAVCSSCSVYQYHALSSDLSEKVNQPFMLENDTIRLEYTFYDGQVLVYIYNKSKQPFYVDWTRSGLIINEEAMPYFAAVPISFVPPATALVNASVHLPDVVNDVYSPETLIYSEQHSPLKFRSYLFLSCDQNFDDEFVFDHSFWISESFQSKEPIYPTRKQNGYVSQRLTGGGSFATGLIGLGAIVGYVALSLREL